MQIYDEMGHSDVGPPIIYFVMDQTERMREYASTMKGVPSLVAIVRNSLLVNAVRMIFVNFIQLAKIMGPVLSIL